MGKLGYFFTTFVGAIPAGFGLYLLIAEVFLERTEKLTTMLLVISITITVCMALVVLTPFMVLVFYKDTRPKLAAAGAAAGAGAGAAAGGGRDDGPDGFDDAIPDDFDEEELAASVGDDFGDDEYDDGGGFEDEYATDDYDDDDYDDDFEDLDF